METSLISIYVSKDFIKFIELPIGDKILDNYTYNEFYRK